MPRQPDVNAARGLSARGTPYVKGPYCNSRNATVARKTAKERNAKRDAQRAAFKAAGLTTRGTPRKNRFANPAVERMVAGRRERLALDAMNAADRADAERRQQLAHDTDPRVLDYRAEKKKKAKRDAKKMAEARAALDRLYADLAAKAKAGRPKRAKAS